jgi:AcrR family transcriptional regulator
MVISEDAVHPRAGRPRDPACDAAILQAALDLFTAAGYAGVSIEGVAARAGVGKATIYRRYASKAELMVEAMRCGANIQDYLPDTGEVRADLLSMLEALLGVLRGPNGKLLTLFAAERVRYAELDDEFKKSVIGRKRQHVRHLVQSAIDRGDLPADTDVELVAETGPALLWHHALNHLPLDKDLPRRTLDLVLPRESS